MRVSYTWLNQYVDLSEVSPHQLAERMTQAGIEIDAVLDRNQGVTDVVVGEVIQKEKHPEADKLNICQVHVGQEVPLQIVCGAKNVAVGQKVPVALVGAVLPGLKIKKAKLRGVESYGMICSTQELGLEAREDGIMILPTSVEVGQSVLEILGLEDQVLELDLTPNRSDCLSMLGVAYEAAALFSKEVKHPKTLSANQDQNIEIVIDEDTRCTHYSAIRFNNVKVGESPLWLQNILTAVGIRPINNIVDLTNYVMLETGQPLHAFDAKYIEGKLHVRKAKKDETLLTLDHKNRNLTEEMIVIADDKKALALAGVMGGKESEISLGTTEIIIEAACFDPIFVRKTSKSLGLRSDSSLRFEKQIDPTQVENGLLRMAHLIVELGLASAPKGYSAQILKTHKEKQICVSLEKINHVLGTDLTVDEVQRILKRLKFEFEQAQETFRVTVPARKLEMTESVDIIEEVARIYGYDNIPATKLEGKITEGAYTPVQELERKISDYLVHQGFNQVIGYAFVDKKQNHMFPTLYEDRPEIKLAMPMSEERSILRKTLIPELLKIAEYNKNRKKESIRIFEIGHVFAEGQEANVLSMCFQGNQTPNTWNRTGKKLDFFEIKGIVEALFVLLGMGGTVTYHAAAPKGFHPNRTAEIRDQQGKVVGYLGQVHPQIEAEPTYVVEIYIEKILKEVSTEVSYEIVSKHPTITRDIALVVPNHLAAGELIQHAKMHGGPWLRQVDIFDVYTGEKLGAEFKSIALNFVYQDLERTLRDEEVQEVHEQMIQSFITTFGVQLRK